jgi:hypothetical protein
MRTRSELGIRTSPADELYTDALDAARRLKKGTAVISEPTLRTFAVRSVSFGRNQDRKVTSELRALSVKEPPVPTGKNCTPPTLDGPATVTNFTRVAADEGFGKKVNRYLQRAPTTALKRCDSGRTDARPRRHASRSEFAHEIWERRRQQGTLQAGPLLVCPVGFRAT